MTRFTIPDASCDHCKNTIERAVGDLEGVGSAALDLDSKQLEVEHGDAVSAESIAAAITDAGYTVEEPKK